MWGLSGAASYKFKAGPCTVRHVVKVVPAVLPLSFP